VAAEQIIKDRKIQERESFLNLSRGAYLLSKVAFLFALSALQMLLFVWVGNHILQIREMTFSYGLILFSSACFANLMGLILSDSMRSIVAIYIVVPFLLVPQILLAGVIVEFDKFHHQPKTPQLVPISGDLMASRWAYEALVVNQYLENPYQRDHVNQEQQESNLIYDLQYLVPALKQQINDALNAQADGMDEEQVDLILKPVRLGISGIFLTHPYPGIEGLHAKQFSSESGQKALQWLNNYRTGLNRYLRMLNKDKDQLLDSLQSLHGGEEAYLKFRRAHHNKQLADLVLNRNQLKRITLQDGQFVRKMEPIYMYPVKRNGRAHFYASVKQLGNLQVSTLTFNMIVIWTMNIVLYIILRYSALKALIGTKRYRVSKLNFRADE